MVMMLAEMSGLAQASGGSIGGQPIDAPGGAVPDAPGHGEQDGGASMFAARSARLEPSFRVTLSLRSVAVCHELGGGLLEPGLCPIPIRFNID
jgi:hypothetical protein